MISDNTDTAEALLRVELARTADELVDVDNHLSLLTKRRDFLLVKGRQLEVALRHLTNEALSSPVTDERPSAVVKRGGSRSPSRGWCTAERATVLRQRWPTYEGVRDIRTALEAVPGPPLPEIQRISTYASNLGLRRPQDFMAKLLKGKTGNETAPASVVATEGHVVSSSSQESSAQQKLTRAEAMVKVSDAIEHGLPPVRTAAPLNSVKSHVRETVAVTMAEAVEWAKQNNVRGTGTLTELLEMINSYRDWKNLPRFVVT